jgi:hypothetical protein
MRAALRYCLGWSDGPACAALMKRLASVNAVQAGTCATRTFPSASIQSLCCEITQGVRCRVHGRHSAMFYHLHEPVDALGETVRPLLLHVKTAFSQGCMMYTHWQDLWCRGLWREWWRWQGLGRGRLCRMWGEMCGGMVRCEVGRWGGPRWRQVGRGVRSGLWELAGCL